MGLASEFREFAVKGNAIDMTVGIIVGAGFGKIVTSLVNDVIMPPVGRVRQDFLARRKRLSFRASAASRGIS